MKFKLNGKTYRYKPKYYKREDDLNIKSPSYSTYRNGKMFYKNGWKDCRFYILKNSGKLKIAIYPLGIIKDGMSEMGKVDSQGYIDIVEISKFKMLLIKGYDFMFFCKIYFLIFMDKVKPIKKNVRYILIALIGSIIYYLINHFYNSALQELINKSNLIQSIIVFLSLSSIINIVHPFTLRKEWSIEEINDLISKKINKNREKIEDEKYRNEQDF
jgi:hypothetical protein